MRMRALMGRGVFVSALLGSLVAGCGGEPGVDGGYSEPEDAASVSEALPTEAEPVGAEGDSGQLTQGLGGCAGTTVSWSQWRSRWNGNTNTEGTYYCYGTVPSTSDGFTVGASLIGSERVGTAQFTCRNGGWELLSGSCDGKVVSTLVAGGGSTTCSSTDHVKTKILGWYLADLKRCADTDGLNWWAHQYNYSTVACLPPTYDGYGTKDNCFRVLFQDTARSTGEYDLAQAYGHIASDEGACGPTAAYPWTNVAANGTTCKYKP